MRVLIMSMKEIMTAIDEYKNLAIQCVLEEDELLIQKKSEAKAEKLEQIMQLIRISQQDAVISELKKTIESLCK